VAVFNFWALVVEQYQIYNNISFPIAFEWSWFFKQASLDWFAHATWQVKDLDDSI
jgi:hypothetical protein